jgi:transposase
MRTQIRNRIHALLDSERGLSLPVCSDIFGKKGLSFLRKLELETPVKTLLLTQQLELLDSVNAQIKEQESRIIESNIADPTSQRLQSMPGFGTILSAVIAAEIDEPTRFNSSSKFCAYVGLVPTTHSSGGKCYQGKMVSKCNKWLRWAFIEGAWVAMSNSSYFGALYLKCRNRGKKANTAITIVARRMAKIVWHMLKEERNYQEKPCNIFPGRSGSCLTVKKAALAA